MIISTTYFAPINHFAALSSGEAIIEAHETFQKHSPRNRAKIMTADGVKLLTVPLVGGRGVRVPITKAEVDYSTNFQREQWRTIVSAYRSSPYWDHFSERIETLFELRPKYLFELNNQITKELLKILKFNVELRFTNSFNGVVEPPIFNDKPYFQVFGDRQPFAANLSILDWIFCNGFLI